MMGTDTDITDRKRLAEELEELDLIVSQSPAVAFLWRAAEGWPVEFVSENIRRFGYTPEDFRTEQVLFAHIVHPDDLERVAAEVAQHSQDGSEEFTQEYRIVTKTGNVRWVEDRTWIRRDEQDVITHYQGIVLDVTERTRAEEALDKEKGRLRILVDEAPLGVSIIGKDGHYEYVNPKFTEIFGYTLEDIPTGREWFARAYPGEEYRNQAISTWIADVQQSERGEAKPRTFAVTCKDGSEKEIDFRPVTMEAGDQFIIYEDITERKRAEEDLYKEKEKFRVLVEEAPLGVSIIGKNGHYQYINPKFVEIVGYTLEDVPTGREWFARAYPDEEYRSQIISTWVTDLEESKGGDARLRTSPVTCKDGSEKVICFRSVTMASGDQFIIYEDITERKRAEEQLLEAKEDAEKARRQEQERRQEAERRRQIAESLADIMNVLNSNQTLDEVLDYITSQAGRLLDNHAAGIYRLQEDGKLTIEATQGLLLAYAGGRKIPVGQEVLRRATETRRPVAAPDLARGASSDGELAPDGQTKATRPWADLYRGLLAVPIIVADEVYGGLALYYSEPRQFPREEIELAAAFADQIGLAIENARLRDQVREAATVAERERLARDLHDAVTQTLFSAGLIAEALPRVWEHSPERAREGLEELRQLTRGALAEMRTLLLELRPGALTEKPLGELLGHLTQAMTSRTRVSVTLTVKGDSSLSPEVQIALYRIAQEALNNVAKHASAAEASVDLHCQPGRVALSIQDDGRGFDAADALPDQLGLGIMRERAERIGATLAIQSQPDHGTHVTVDWLETDRGQPDVVLMDLRMPGMGGAEATQALLCDHPEVKVIALTSFQEGTRVQQALQAGAIGYLLKDVGADELAEAIRAAHAGRATISPEAIKALVEAAMAKPDVGHDLTGRELDVLALLVEGLGNAEIAERLVISHHTARYHVSSILSKLGAANRAEAAALAVKLGLVT
jgi:PAS domain S-box-containing protein